MIRIITEAFNNSPLLLFLFLSVNSYKVIAECLSVSPNLVKQQYYRKIRGKLWWKY